MGGYGDVIQRISGTLVCNFQVLGIFNENMNTLNDSFEIS